MLIFEKSRPGRHCSILPPCDVELIYPGETRQTGAAASSAGAVGDGELSRHYTELAKQMPRGERRVLPLGFLHDEI